MALVSLVMRKGHASAIPLAYLRWINAWMLATLIILMTICSSSQGQSIQSNATVSTDGSGQFTTIQAAIDAAPNMSVTKYYIWIRAGRYMENILVGNKKHNIVLIGDGMDRTVISGNRSNTTGFSTYETATVGIKGQGFAALNITFENTAGPYGNQAVAGWLPWEGRSPDKLDEVIYAEYDNKGPGANTKGRVPWAREINSSSEAAEFTVKNFINGSGTFFEKTTEYVVKHV
ncbi:hypothetical protein Vadar_015632 [Vaccinium darrowii]|uniref:Uncharacterized protein n=1 Tax=Vaccinium darrowii TaxID=229202 RepID=A0ACB7ZKI7_9ERIC|nr:hypothetical protein Vadar_015632 [Vaccinium darrowii]